MKKQPYYSFFDSDEKTRNAIECFLHIKMNPLFKQFYRKVGSFLPSKPCKIRTFLFQLVQNYQSERKRATMNVRKPVDYGTMYRELTAILTQNLSQMDEVYAIGKAISQRPEKGAAVAAAEFLQANFPDRAGFSPRNVRRMRDFYKTYENDQTLLRLAMKIGWTLNVVIMEAELTSEARKWYLKQARERQWSKKELLDILSSGFEPDTEADHENSSLRFSESCGIINQKMKEQPLSHLAITLSKAMQVRTFRSSFWKRPRNWLDLLLTEICWTAYWFIWSIWRAHPAEIRRCLGRESTPVSVQCCWSSGLRIPYLKEV